ncbi:MAG: hypothetical protein ABUL58_08525 [Steroidobacter sp.]
MSTTNAYLKQHHTLNACNAACVLAACAIAGHESLRASAARLADASSHFSLQFQYQGDDLRWRLLNRNAKAMATSAYDLNLAVSSGRTGGEVDDEYRRVTDNYQQLHVQLAREGHVGAEQSRVLADFDRITTAYRSVEAAMGPRAVTRYQNQLLYSALLICSKAGHADPTDVT